MIVFGYTLQQNFRVKGILLTNEISSLVRCFDAFAKVWGGTNQYQKKVWKALQIVGARFCFAFWPAANSFWSRSSSSGSAPMHYRLRAIRGVPSGVVNFTPHFIAIQIFQILFLPPVSFYTHPNFSDIFLGDKINLFNLTFHDIPNH